MKTFNRILIIMSLMFAINTNAQEMRTFTLGADISWSSELEAAGYTYVNAQGKECSCVELVKGVGVKAVRLRVWVNPSNGYNGKADVIRKAKNVKAQGLDLMIDFHFSDTWADPAHQVPPAAWNGHNLTQLCRDITNHIKDVLTALKDEDIAPKWVQIGNETNDGLLWETGRASKNPSNYNTLMSAAYDAVKNVCQDAKVIAHLSNAHDQSLYDWNLKLLDPKKFDLIGMSIYPESYTDVEKAVANIKHQWKALGKETMIVEVGLRVNSSSSSKMMQNILSQMMNKTDNHCLGIFYWEPESFNGWNGGYDKGAALLSGKSIRLGPIMDAFKDACEIINAVQHQEAFCPVSSYNTPQRFTICGLPATDAHSGIIIQKGKKYMLQTTR